MLIISAGAVQLAGAMHVAGSVQLGIQELATFLGHGPLGHAAGSLGRELGGLVGLAGLVGSLAHRRARAEQQVQQEHRLREEVMAYLTLDLPSCALERNRFAQLLSRTIATRSSFARAALMLRNSSGTLTVAGSAGMDDLTVGAINRWGAAASASLLSGARASAVFTDRVGASSFVVKLEQRHVTPGRRPADNAWVRSSSSHTDCLRGGTAGGHRRLRGAAARPGATER